MLFSLFFLLFIYYNVSIYIRLDANCCSTPLVLKYKESLKYVPKIQGILSLQSFLSLLCLYVITELLTPSNLYVITELLTPLQISKG